MAARGAMRKFEDAMEHVIFGSRWIMAPIYLALAVALALVALMFFRELWHIIDELLLHDYPLEEAKVALTLGVLGLLGLALIGNLVLIVIVAGYENFVSKIGVATESEGRPHWMGTIDFSGLKIKLVGSLVAISVIELLQDFIEFPDRQDYEGLAWRIGLHVTFLFSGVMFAWMDLLSDKRKKLLHDLHGDEVDPEAPAAVTVTGEIPHATGEVPGVTQEIAKP